MNQIVNESTSVIQIDSSGLQNGQASVVYVSSTTIPGQFVTVIDATGYVSSPQSILLSTVGTAVFSDGSTSIPIKQRFGYVSLVSQDRDHWSATNRNSFPDPLAAASYRALDAPSTTTSTLTASGFVSTTTAIANNINLGSTAYLAANAYAQSLYINALPQYYGSTPTTYSAYVEGNAKGFNPTTTIGAVSILGSISTGADFYVSRNISSKLGTIYVGGNVNVGGNILGQRGTLISVNTIQATTSGSFNGNTFANANIFVGNAAEAGSISTGTTLSALGLAVTSSLQLGAGSNAIQYTADALNFVNTSVTVPSISTNFLQAGNSLTTSNLTFQRFGPADTLQSFSMIASQIQNAGGSFSASSITGNVAGISVRTQATQVSSAGNLPCATITMNDSGDPVALTNIVYPPFSSTVLGTASFSNYWTISSVGAGGTLYGGSASLSTNTVFANKIFTPRLATATNMFSDVRLNTLGVVSSIFFSSATLLSLRGTNVNNIGGGIAGSRTETTSYLQVSSIQTDLISTIDLLQFSGHSSISISTATISSLSARTIQTSSLTFSAASLGNPINYSTINPSTAYLIGSPAASSLGSYFQPLPINVTTDQVAYYSIVNPAGQIPVNLSSIYVNTLAGNGAPGYSGDGGAAATAVVGTVISQPAADLNYNLFFGANYKGWSLRQIDTNSNITTIAGNNQYFYGDGGYPTAGALGPRLAMATYPAGGLLISDSSGQRIRYVDTEPILATIAGTGVPGYSGDGDLAISASFFNPGMMAVDSASNIFIADASNNRIRKITGGSTISLYAGTGAQGGTGDGGAALAATFNNPYGLAINSSNLLFVADTGNCVVRTINPATGIIQIAAGNYTPGFSGDNQDGTNAQMAYPTGITADPTGTIYICDTGNARVRRMLGTPPYTLSTIAGNGTNAYSGDGGPAYLAALSSPTGITTDPNGNLYIADTGNQCIRFVDVTTGFIRTVAGQATRSGNSGDFSFATFALLSNPGQVTFDPGSGYCYVADNGNNRIRYIDTNQGIINAYAGNGSPFSAGNDILASYAVFGSIHGVTADRQNSIYVADGAANIIRRIDLNSGYIYSAVGTGTGGFSGDGAALSAALSTPHTIVADSNNDVYICDTNNHRVRKYLAASGALVTIAGTGVAGYNGDGIPATAADLNYPKTLTLDGLGNIYIGDSSNYRVRQLSLQTGLITTALGNGTLGTISTSMTTVETPIGVVAALTTDSTNTLYFADATTSALWKVSSATFVANSAVGPGYLGDAGPLSNAVFNAPTGYFYDTSGNFVVCDGGNFRIRRSYTYGLPQVATYLNLNLTYTNYFTSSGVTTIRLNGNVLQTFTAATQSTTSYTVEDLNIYNYPLQGSNPVLGNQIPYLEISQAGGTGYTKLAGNISINTRPGQQLLQNIVDSTAGIVMNRGTLRFPYSNTGITIQNRYNDASMRTINYNGSLINPSDPALKENIQAADLGICYQTLATLPLRSYTYIQPYTSTFHVDDAPRLGFLTREVAPYFPHSVTTIPFEQAWAPSSIQTLDMAQIKFAHLGATQHLMREVSSMEAELEELTSSLRRMATQRNAVL